MKQYIGKDISSVMIDEGAPVNQFDMSEGRRAFQYYLGGGTFALPQTTTQHGNVSVIGNTGYYNSTSITSGGGVYSSKGCLVTYFARQDKNKKSWVIESISYPERLFC